jgi:uncharacterized membrane protein YphA (DoxX/SURF4 family)
VVAWLQEMIGVCVAFVATLFLYAGTAKLLSLSAFRRDLLLIPYLPRSWSRPIGVGVPLAEVAIGISLLLGLEAGKIAAIAMLTVFSTIALLAHSRNQQVPCNCFGVDHSEQLSLATIARNSVLTCMTAASLFFADARAASVAKGYGLIAFILFLCVHAAVKNDREFREALRWRLLA